MEERRQDYPQLLRELTEIRKTLERLCSFINGNGQPGAKIRLDRLERVTGVVVWAGSVLVVGCLGFAGWMVQTAFNRVFQ